MYLYLVDFDDSHDEHGDRDANDCRKWSADDPPLGFIFLSLQLQKHLRVTSDLEPIVVTSLTSPLLFN